MVKKVLVPRYEAANGTQFLTEKEAQMHEWQTIPADVKPVAVKFKGVTRDLMGSLWAWSCGRCKAPASQPLDTCLIQTSISCEHCGAGNHFHIPDYDNQRPRG